MIVCILPPHSRMCPGQGITAVEGVATADGVKAPCRRSRVACCLIISHKARTAGQPARGRGGDQHCTVLPRKGGKHFAGIPGTCGHWGPGTHSTHHKSHTHRVDGATRGLSGAGSGASPKIAGRRCRPRAKRWKWGGANHSVRPFLAAACCLGASKCFDAGRTSSGGFAVKTCDVTICTSQCLCQQRGCAR